MAELNSTPKGERVHIAFFGRRNAGKSSLVNAFTGQNIAIVSDVLGTTTDPVYKAMELLPLGPVEIIDTPGFDDVGDLGLMRVEKTKQVLNKTDLAILVSDATEPLSEFDENMISLIKDKNIPYIIAKSKADLLENIPESKDNIIFVSANTGYNINELKELAAKSVLTQHQENYIVSDLLSPLDVVVLVTPIDKAAPKGRLILPQQQTIRDILDKGAIPVVCRDTELTKTLEKLKMPPRMVITDSQAFAFVNQNLPKDIPLTSFSILMARYKGDLKAAVEGAVMIENIKKGDKILVAEGCTHHRQCGDIGTVKIPMWIKKHLGFDPEYTFVSGTEFPEDLSEYKLVVHCGGCTLNEREMKYRLSVCKNGGIPVTNYGILIAYLNGILKRTVEPFEDLAEIIK